MPLYDYRCRACDHTHDEYQSMRDDPLTHCPQCGSTEYGRVPTLPTPDREYGTPIQMFSIGLNHPDDIAEFKRACPDVDIATDENDPLYGVPIARTRRQKLAALNAAGFEERN